MHVYTVSVEMAGREDAKALRDLIEELGFTATMTYRTLDSGPSTPARDTRLGRYILRHMVPERVYSIEEVAAEIETAEYSPTSAATMLSVLATQGDVIRVERGQYQRKG